MKTKWLRHHEIICINYQLEFFGVLKNLFELKHQKWSGAELLVKENYLICLANWKGTGNTKMKLDFFKISIILFQNNLFPKNYLRKLNIGLELVSSAYILNIIPMTIFHIKNSIGWPSFNIRSSLILKMLNNFCLAVNYFHKKAS